MAPAMPDAGPLRAWVDPVLKLIADQPEAA